MKTNKLKDNNANFMQAGRQLECSNCHPEKGYADCQTILKETTPPMKCECICHDKERSDIPAMGVSQWKAHGEKYGYDKFFENKYINEIPLQNGILNVITKEIKPFNPKQIFFNKMPVIFNSTALNPNIEKFLTDILPNEEDLTVIYEIIGSGLYKDYLHLSDANLPELGCPDLKVQYRPAQAVAMGSV